MGGPQVDVRDTCARLRMAQARVLAPMSQADVVAAVCAWADGWNAPHAPWRRAAAGITDSFPFAMARVSLDALLHSLTPSALRVLIHAEKVDGKYGAPLVGHVIAGNSPLLVWTSVLRALLMRSASFVKLPSGGAAEWGRLFLQSFAEKEPRLASCVHLAQWPGGTTGLDAALCDSVDLLMAYGGEDTLNTLRALCPAPVLFRGYGHRVSFGIVAAGASAGAAARGLARDVLLYDQGGCLSPHTVLVEGDRPTAHRFADLLQRALQEAVGCYPNASRSPQAAARVQEARLLARMEAGTAVWEDPDMRWTVIARPDSAFRVSPTHGVISVQPLAGSGCLAASVAPVAGRLQGCAVALPPGTRASSDRDWRPTLGVLGVSWVCRPGRLQAPPFAWREDGRPVLRSLLSSDAAPGA